MPAAIVLTGISANDPTPGSFEEVNYAQGAAGGDNIAYPVLILANKTSAGSATADTVIYGPDTQVPIVTESDIINLAGTGSEAHRMWLRFTRVNKVSALYFVFVAESTGTAASLTLTVTGAATANGTIRVWVVDEFVDVSVSTGDSAATIATNIAAAINTQTRWPVTAAQSTNTVVITARQKGPRGNFIDVQTQVIGSITTTVSASTKTPLSGGATADSNANALATILSRRFFYIVSAAEDATQAGALLSQINSQALPTSGKRQHMFVGSKDTLANAITRATGLNGARAALIWQQASDWTPAELAAHVAGVVALKEAEQLPRPLHNFSGFGNDAVTSASWFVPAPRTGAGPTQVEIKSALNNGISPIAPNQNGTSYLVKLCTTRSLNGSTADYRVRDWHRATIPDFYADALHARTILQFSGKDLADDPPRGAPPPPANVVTPSRFRAMVIGLINDFASNAQLKNVEQIKNDLIVQREASPTNRISTRTPLQCIDIADQFTHAIDQVA
jgi:phage tail sheath gpL-like